MQSYKFRYRQAGLSPLVNAYYECSNDLYRKMQNVKEEDEIEQLSKLYKNKVEKENYILEQMDEKELYYVLENADSVMDAQRIMEYINKISCKP